MMELVRSKSDEANLAIGQESDQSRRRQTRADELQEQVMQLAESMRVAVIFGGDKRVPGAVINPTFNPRSWKSYEAVAEDIAAALRNVGFRFVTTLPDGAVTASRWGSLRPSRIWETSIGIFYQPTWRTGEDCAGRPGPLCTWKAII